MSFTEEEILKIQPFKSKIGHIDNAESLKCTWAISGESFKITAEGRKYKLRCCKSEREAEQIRENTSRLPKYFPKFVGCEGQFVLFDWIDGEFIEELAIEDCYFIGKMMGEAHALGIIATNIGVNTLFESRIPILRKVFSEDEMSRIIDKYNQMTEKLDLDIVLEFSDVHKRNFIKDKQGNIYYVDEEGFNYKVKGLGIAKPLLTTDWIKTQEEKDAFWKGYNEHHSSDYFDTDYQKFIVFLQQLRTIAVRIRSGADYSKELSDVRNVIN